MIQPRALPDRPRIGNSRSARNATATRIVRNGRARYANLVRVSAVLGCVLAMLLGYVMLTSNITSMTYAVAEATRDREALQEQTARLDDRIATLTSDERLSRIAVKLGMRDPQTFATIVLGAPVAQDTTHFAVLSSLAGWFSHDPRAREH